MSIKERIAALDKLMQWRKDRVNAHELEIKKLWEERLSLYRDGGLMPYDLMAPEEKRKIEEMKDAGFACEYCEAHRVKKGKKLICMACGHEQRSSI